jgi:hypothetical protein
LSPRARFLPIIIDHYHHHYHYHYDYLHSFPSLAFERLRFTIAIAGFRLAAIIQNCEGLEDGTASKLHFYLEPLPVSFLRRTGFSALEKF